MHTVTAAINAALGLIVFILELRSWYLCQNNYRWVFLLKALAGISLATIMLDAAIRGTVIDPLIGRPVITLTLAALTFGAVFQHRVNNGGCNGYK